MSHLSRCQTLWIDMSSLVDSPHFICRDCVCNFVRSMIGTDELRARQGLPCVVLQGSTTCTGPLWQRGTAFDRSQVEPLLDTELRAAFSAITADASTSSTLPEIIPEERASVTIDQASVVPISFLTVAEQLNVTCPSCTRIVDPSPDGCIAMICAHCRKPFCWMCLEAVSGNDAHRHCMDVHLSYFPPLRHVAAWHRLWRWQRISRLLPKQVARSVEAVQSYLESVRPLLAGQSLWPFPETPPSLPTPSSFDGAWFDALTPPLHRAAAADDVDALQEALDGGAELDAQDDRGMTALMHAAHGGHLQAAEWLLQSGANATLEDRTGLGALCFACREGHVAVAAALLRRCGRALEQEVVDAKILPWASAQLPDETNADEDAETDGRPAVAQELFETVLALPSVKVDVCHTGGVWGWPALTWAARGGAVGAVRSLMAKHTAHKQAVHASALGEAWRAGHIEICRELLEVIPSRGSEGGAIEVLQGRMLSHALSDALEYRCPADVSMLTALLRIVAADWRSMAVALGGTDARTTLSGSEEDADMDDGTRRCLRCRRHLERFANVMAETPNRHSAGCDAPPPELRVVRVLFSSRDKLPAAPHIRNSGVVDWVYCVLPGSAQEVSISEPDSPTRSAKRLWLPELGVYVSQGVRSLGDKVKPAPVGQINVARDQYQWDEYGDNCGCDYCMGYDVAPGQMLLGLEQAGVGSQWAGEDAKLRREKKILATTASASDRAAAATVRTKPSGAEATQRDASRSQTGHARLRQRERIDGGCESVASQAREGKISRGCRASRGGAAANVAGDQRQETAA
eukprot:CAMPEP_0181182980 /NCGR_PEP_ID=MMETSP1096-20121128/8175_1 /TAXON_ID=156174 ORGANISM="Chrysochromulina ericina, Strain CCMP281" /NCGR_SAMPLE_ID=MMETSP1096 /ASSEMBLY_ACC=CAM_ASM_000453 /LENGTH=804 /DNA_ID=CAMNT_0023271617 /DNA_START=42 /DNA_END=2457 /DNA_ORIENTATION=+